MKAATPGDREGGLFSLKVVCRSTTTIVLESIPYRQAKEASTMEGFWTNRILGFLFVNTLKVRNTQTGYRIGPVESRT
jgi:hypothetical protein